MLQRLTMFFALAALALLEMPAVPAFSAPKPKATPLKTISHEYVSPLCTGLRKAIGPAIGKALQNDKIIANSKPLFHQYVQAAATNQNKASQDLSVSRLERLVGPLVKNTETIDTLLNDPFIFPKVAYTDGDRRLLQMRAQLQAVNDEQKHALDVISGFVQTQQLGEMQTSGHEFDSALSANPNPPKQYVAPTAPPQDVLSAGVQNTNNDPSRAVDPRYKNTDSVLGANPLDVFENAISSYQQDIHHREQRAAKSVIAAVPLCGGHAPAQPAPARSPLP